MLEVLYTIAAGIAGQITYATIHNYVDIQKLFTAAWLMLTVIVSGKASKVLNKPALPLAYLSIPVLAVIAFILKAIDCDVCTTFWFSLIVLLVFSTGSIPTIVSMAFVSVLVGSLYRLIRYSA
jgi:hypothetical protein